MTLQINQVLNHHYEIVRLLGRGGMGSVYCSRDVTLNRMVAIKERTPDPRASPLELAEERAQFRREAQVLAGLSHPNLPQIYEFFSSGANEYVVMELIEGQSLQELLDLRVPLTESTVRAWANQILDALNYIHCRNIIHRDIKPANIIVKPDGKVFLVDFGLVKLINPNNPGAATVMRMGTPEYAPLEQFGDLTTHTDERSDIYSFGATLFALLTGRNPVPAQGRVLDPTQQPALRTLVPKVSPQMEAVVQKSMEVYPEKRWKTVAEMRQALDLPPPPPPQTYTTPTKTKLPPPTPIAPTKATRPTYTAPTAVLTARSKDSLRNWIVAVTTVGLAALFTLNQILPGFVLTPTPTAARAAAMASVTVSPTIAPSPTQSPVPMRTALPTAIPTATPTSVLPTQTATRIPLSPTPTTTLTAACSNPQAQITNPRMDVTIRQGTNLQVIGTANIPGFKFYRVHFQPDGGIDWGILAKGEQPVMNGVLMVWHTGTVDLGTYWLRLIVEDPTGNYPEPCIVRVVIR